MNKLALCVAAFIAGLMLCFGLFFTTTDRSIDTTHVLGICPGFLTQQSYAVFTDSGGSPFRFTSVKHVDGYCGDFIGKDAPPAMELFKHYFVTWQLYVNWLVCSLPFFGAVILYQKRRAA